MFITRKKKHTEYAKRHGISRLDGALHVLGHFSVTVARKVGEVADVLALAVLRLNGPTQEATRRWAVGRAT